MTTEPKASDHTHQASVYTRCHECHIWGINLPGNTRCGNCGGDSTTLYRPPCCFDAVVRERDAERLYSDAERLYSERLFKQGEQLKGERDAARAKLAVAVEALRQYASNKSKRYEDANGNVYYQGDGGHRARAALAKLEGKT